MEGKSSKIVLRLREGCVRGLGNITPHDHHFAMMTDNSDCLIIIIASLDFTNTSLLKY